MGLFNHCFVDMAQTMLQVQRMWDGLKYEELQGLQQRALLRGVSHFSDYLIQLIKLEAMHCIKLIFIWHALFIYNSCMNAD